MWKLEFSKLAERDVLSFDKTVQEALAKYFQKVIESGNPRSFGKALTGNKKGLWRYRIGDYRAICEIMNNELKIIAVRIGHRNKIYD